MALSFPRIFMFSVITLALTISALGVTTAYADDATPPPATEEPAQPPTDEPFMVVEPTVTAEPVATQEPVATEGPVATQEPAATEEPAATSTEEEAASVAEVLEQLPADTTLVVLDENGETLTLASDAAAQVLASPDPYFWVGSVYYGFTATDCNPGVPGDQACSNPIQAAVDYLSTILVATPDGGTIYVESGTYDEDVTINGGAWGLPPGDLSLRGAGSGSTTINGSLLVFNLTNAFALSGFTFTDFVTLSVLSPSGDVNVSDVVVDGTTAVGGLNIISGGNVTLDRVTSFESSGLGASVRAVGADGDITIWDSTFEDNTLAGLDAQSMNGSITLDGVTASWNDNGEGASAEADGDILIRNSVFNHNMVGLYADATSGSVTLNGVTANGNDAGAIAVSFGNNVLVLNSVFNDNVDFGLIAASAFGSVTLDGVTASGNGDAGAYLLSNTLVDVYCSDFSSNDIGVDGDAPDLYLNGVAFSGNTTDYVNPGGNVHIGGYDCGGGSEKALYYIIELAQDQLPGALGQGNVFGSALKVVLTDKGARIPHLTITLSFPIPEGMKDARLAVMFWDGSGWVVMPGGSVVGGYFVITITRPGTYVLVSQ
jgi:hypothetical protein